MLRLLFTALFVLNKCKTYFGGTFITNFWKWDRLRVEEILFRRYSTDFFSFHQTTIYLQSDKMSTYLTKLQCCRHKYFFFCCFLRFNGIHIHVFF